MGFKAYIEILRPINCILGSLTVLIGILNAHGSDLILFIQNSQNLLLLIGGLLVYFLIAGASNIINDYFDLEIDKINRPNRPIPRGDISKSTVLYYYTALIFIAVGLSVPIGLISPNLYLIPVICFIFSFVGFLYGWKGKISGFLGNLMVGVSFSFGIPFGALLLDIIGDIPKKIWFFFLTSMFLLISREFVKGMEDIEGDRSFNIKTVANTWGYKSAAILSSLFSIFAILTFTIPAILLSLNIFFLIFMILGNLVVVLSIVVLMNNYTIKDNQKRSSLYLKIGAFCGLLAYILALI